MNIKFLAVAFFSAIIFLCNNSCKKYPEGPLMSFKTKTARITGDWTVAEYNVNGVDSAILDNSFYQFKIDFTSPKDQNPVVSGTYFIGNWYLQNHKREIQLMMNPYPIKSPTFSSGKINFKILRLTNEDFWFTGQINSNNYVLKLKKEKDHG